MTATVPGEAAGERVVVAMSGGVDSSVAAALVARSLGAGGSAIGVTLHLAGSASRCCSLDDVDDARRIAEDLGLRFFVMNEKDRFHDEVMLPFADEYRAGRTPIPCVTCNKRFKFDALLERARAFGAERVATGHFARVEYDPESGLQWLLRGRDRSKDQSYFLFQLDQAQLARCWFPLGDRTKREVREVARSLGLSTAEKPESHEICFVPDGDYARVVEELRPEARGTDGEIVDATGRVLGRHQGVHRFTVGQRRGLGIGGEAGGGGPWYVTSIDAASRRVTVGHAASLEHRRVHVRDVAWIAGLAPAGPVRCEVQVRHRHAAQPATVTPGDASTLVEFDAPARAVAPGQAAVFYAGDGPNAGARVLGGGWIVDAAA